MPYSMEINRDARMVFGRCWGEFPVEEAIEGSLELIRDERFEPGFGIVVDAREVLSVPIADEVIDFSAHLTHMRKYLGHRVAVVAQGDVATVAELAAAIVSGNGPTIQVFSEMEAARAWASDRSEPGRDELNAP